MLQRGGGPDIAFRAYLLTAVRRLRVDRIRADVQAAHHRRHGDVRPGRPVPRHRGRGLRERGRRRARSRRCPSGGSWCCGTPRSRARSPPTSRLLLGMSANSVSALAYRAREGLRQAFLNEHVHGARGRDCRWTHDHLGAYIRNGVSQARRRQGRGPPRRVPHVHGDLPRAERGQLQPRRDPRRRCCSAAPRAAYLGRPGDRGRRRRGGADSGASATGRDQRQGPSRSRGHHGVALGGGGFLVWQDPAAAAVSGEVAALRTPRRRRRGHGTRVPADATAGTGQRRARPPAPTVDHADRAATARSR